MKYKAIPWTVEAVQFRNTKECMGELCELGLDYVTIREKESGHVLEFENFLGLVAVKEGDYIVRTDEKAGHWFTALDKKRFEQAYEPAEREN